jgi:hypothetical protein
MNDVVVHVRAGDVPHLPSPVRVSHVGFINTAAFPILRSGEHWSSLVYPLNPIPFEIANRVRSPKILCAARVVNTLDPPPRPGIPTFDIRRAVPPTLQIPGRAEAVAGKQSRPSRIAPITSHPPSSSRKRYARRKRCAKELRRPIPAYLSRSKHPPLIASLNDRRIAELRNINRRIRPIRRIKDLCLFPSEQYSPRYRL